MAENHVKTITVKELTRKILDHEETFILDVRNTDDFDDWKIEGKFCRMRQGRLIRVCCRTGSGSRLFKRIFH